jgi:hypothetical protein
VALAIMAWIGAVLVLDAIRLSTGPSGPGARELAGAELLRQLCLGAATWTVLTLALRRESAVVRVQALIVVALATVVEYTFSPLLEAYVYRIGTVPFFVPPGHGLVYLGALVLGRRLFGRRLLGGQGAAGSRRVLHAATFAVLLVGGAWAVAGLASDRPDHLGAFWFLCLAGFLAWGPSRALYVGAFVVVSYLELVGTALGTWAWAPSDPVLGVVGQGNPPSGAAGGYGWFDLYALLLAPSVLRGVRGVVARGRRQTLPSRSRIWSCSRPLVATALPPNGPGTPSSDVNLPPASTTIGTRAAMSYSSSSGSVATSTAPSATSM